MDLSECWIVEYLWSCQGLEGSVPISSFDLYDDSAGVGRY
jgi:hypothetical protein